MLPRINNLTDDDKEIVLGKQDILSDTDKMTKLELDKINPNSNDVLLGTLPNDAIDDLYKNGVVDEHKNIIWSPSLNEYLATIPEDIDSIEKIMDKLSGNVNDDIIHALSSLPKQHNKLNQLPTEALKVLEDDGIISLPQNYNDTKFSHSHKSSKDFKIRHRSKISSSKRTESPSSVSNNMPIDSLLKNCPILTQNDISKALKVLENDINSVKVASLESPLIEDLYKRGLIDSRTTDPIIKDAINNVDTTRMSNSQYIPSKIKNICLNTPVKKINPHFEIVDYKGNEMANVSDLVKYLSSKAISKGGVPWLPWSIANNLSKMPGRDICLKELPLSLLVELCKNNEVGINRSAVNAMNWLLADLLKPRKRNNYDYKKLMNDIKLRDKGNKGRILSPKTNNYKSHMHPPQNLRSSVSSSKLILPSDTTCMYIHSRFGQPDTSTMHISGRFVSPDTHSSQIKQSTGYLMQKSKISSPKLLKKSRMLSPNNHLSTRLETMHRFYPQETEIFTITDVNIYYLFITLIGSNWL